MVGSGFEVSKYFKIIPASSIHLGSVETPVLNLNLIYSTASHI
jgi:hypothetical protein